MSLFTIPERTFFAVLNGNALLRQLIADLIRERPILLLLELKAEVDKHLNEGIGGLSGVGLAIVEDEAEDVREFTDLVLGGVKLRLGSARVAHGVDLADELEDLAECAGGVEVIVHVFNEAFLDGSDLRVEGVDDG